MVLGLLRVVLGELHFVFALAERRTPIISRSARRHTKRRQRKREPALLHSSSVWVLHHPSPFFPSPPLSPPQVLPPSVMSLNHISAQITSGFSIFIILTYDHDTNILKPILLRFLLKFEKKYLLEIKIRWKCVFILRLIKWMCKGTINLLFFKYSVISGWYTIIILLNISLLMFVTK